MRKSIIGLVSGAVGATASAILIGHNDNKKIEKSQKLADKHLLILQNMNQWLCLKQKGKTLRPYFDQYGYKNVVIYGMSYLGERLYDDLKEIGITVAYAVDKNATNLYADIEIYSPDEELPKVDAIIVTATYFIDEIEETLSQNNDFPIVPIEDILYFE